MKHTKATTVIVLEPTAKCSYFTSRLWQIWALLDPDVVPATWNSESKRFETFPAYDLQPGRLAPPAHTQLDLPLKTPIDWIVFPELFHSFIGRPELVEVDMILEARRLGAKTSFIFHGVKELMSGDDATRSACARYMQAMLLSDLVLPLSRLASDQILDFFVCDQRADYIPNISKVTCPIEIKGFDARWLDFVRQVQSILGETLDPSRRLKDIFILDSPVQGSVDAANVHDLAVSFRSRDVCVHRLEWSSGELRNRLVIGADGADVPLASAGGRLPLAEQPWLLIAFPVKNSLLSDVVANAHSIGFRVAAIVDIPPDGSYGVDTSEPGCAALAGVDKIIATSEACQRHVSDAMLAWRGKVSSFETRLVGIGKPTEVRGFERQAVPLLGARDRGLCLLVWPQGDARHSIMEGFAEAKRRSPFPLDLRVIDETSQLVNSTGDQLIHDTLDTPDLVIHGGSPGERDKIVALSLWRGIPCLLHSASGQASAHQKGVYYTDLLDAAEVTSAVLRLCRRDVYQALSREAVSRPVKTWDAYVHEVSQALVNDRLGDGVYRPGDFQRRPALLLELAKRPKLSICISTYKRAAWLTVNLKNIFEQLPAHDGEIEVVVVDNTSPDITPEVVRPYLARPDFFYRRNPVNVGMLGNLAVTAQVARGEYIWILGDDDLTRPGAIEKVLSILQEHEDLALIYMNYGYTTEYHAGKVTDLPEFLSNYNVLQPEEADHLGTVKELSAKTENFYTAIYTVVFKRDHAMRAYCQDTSGRIFSTMTSCIPTSFYILNFMPDMKAYWIGSHALIANSNVSWVDYSPLFELEQFPRAWDLAEKYGTPASQVDQRREARLPHTVNAWSKIFEDDKAGNGPYIEADRVLMRIKHLESIVPYIPQMYLSYRKAHIAGNASASIPPKTLFGGFIHLLHADRSQLSK